MRTRPRISEALLAALCPAGDFRDGVLGDLAEEYAARVATDGRAAARRWYRYEALRTSPHAALAWVRGVRAPEAARLIAATVGTWFVVHLIADALMVTVVVSWGTVPDSFGILFAAWRDVEEFMPLVAIFVHMMTWATVIACGYWTARLDRRAPLAGAISVGLVLMVGLLVEVPLIWHTRGVAGNVAALILLSSWWLALPTLGGVLYVLRGHKRPVNEESGASALGPIAAVTSGHGPR